MNRAINIKFDLCRLLHDITGDEFFCMGDKIRRTMHYATTGDRTEVWTEEKAVKVLKGYCTDYSMMVGRSLSFLQQHKLL